MNSLRWWWTWWVVMMVIPSFFQVTGGMLSVLVILQFFLVIFRARTKAPCISSHLRLLLCFGLPPPGFLCSIRPLVVQHPIFCSSAGRRRQLCCRILGGNLCILGRQQHVQQQRLRNCSRYFPAKQFHWHSGGKTDDKRIQECLG